MENILIYARKRDTYAKFKMLETKEEHCDIKISCYFFLKTKQQVLRVHVKGYIEKHKLVER